MENIKELLSAMKEFDNLESFLEHVALATSVDQEWDGEKIKMMTMHAAKGLEFEVVFLPEIKCFQKPIYKKRMLPGIVMLVILFYIRASSFLLTNFY